MFARTSLVLFGASALTLGGCGSNKANWADSSFTTPGAPAHASADEKHETFRYFYYPDEQVYRDTGSGTYFWMERGEWKKGVPLPSYIFVDFTNLVKVELDSDTPYNHHSKVARAHPGKGRRLGHVR